MRAARLLLLLHPRCPTRMRMRMRVRRRRLRQRRQGVPLSGVRSSDARCGVHVPALPVRHRCRRRLRRRLRLRAGEHDSLPPRTPERPAAGAVCRRGARQTPAASAPPPFAQPLSAQPPPPHASRRQRPEGAAAQECAGPRALGICCEVERGRRTTRCCGPSQRLPWSRGQGQCPRRRWGPARLVGLLKPLKSGVGDVAGVALSRVK